MKITDYLKKHGIQYFPINISIADGKKSFD